MVEVDDLSGLSPSPGPSSGDDEGYLCLVPSVTPPPVPRVSWWGPPRHPVWGPGPWTEPVSWMLRGSTDTGEGCQGPGGVATRVLFVHFLVPSPHANPNPDPNPNPNPKPNPNPNPSPTLIRIQTPTLIPILNPITNPTKTVTNHNPNPDPTPNQITRKTLNQNPTADPIEIAHHTQLQ